jgi:branched-chain amino acid transport system ATP-binding protein
VEENPERVIDVADRVYLMDHGEIVWFGKGADMLANDTLISTYLGA